MTATTEETQSISLYYREGASDKEYHVRLEPKDTGYVVNIAYGRRGSTLSTGTKTSSPVYYDAALMIFERVVREKRAKGYTEGKSGTPYQHAEQSHQVSGLLPQLLNAIDEVEASRHRAVHRDGGQGLPIALGTEREVDDVDAGRTQARADLPDHAGLVFIAHQKDVRTRIEVQFHAIQTNDARPTMQGGFDFAHGTTAFHANTQQAILYRSNINVSRSEMDTLKRYPLNVNTTGVQGSF